MQRPGPLTVLLIEDSPDYAALVQRWLSSGDPNAFVLNWTDTLEAGLRRLSQGGVDVVLLDLGLSDSDGPRTFTTVSEQAAEVPLIVLSGAESEILALRMIQRGAQDYLVKNTCTADLLTRALQYAVIRHQSRTGGSQDEKAGRRRIVGVVGSAGGTGTTTVSCVLAADLRLLTDQPVLLADLDLTAGMVNFISGVASERSLLDAMRNIDRLDLELWTGIVAHKSGDLDILAAPGVMQENDPDADVVQRVFHQVKRYYDWMVLDLGRLDRIAASIVGWSTDILVVTTHDLPCLHQCKRTIETLQERGLPSEQIHVVVNQRDDQRDLSRRDLQSLFGVGVLAILPPATRELNHAILQKRLPAVSSAFRQELTAAARSMAGLAVEKPNAMLRPLVSIADRLRRTRGADRQGAAR